MAMMQPRILMGLLLLFCCFCSFQQGVSTTGLFPPHGIVDITTFPIYFAAVNTNTTIYVIGGFFHSNQGGEPSSSVYAYSLNGTYLTQLPPLSIPRGHLSSVVVNDRFILAVGGTADLAGKNALPSVEIFDLSMAEGKWMTLGNLSLARMKPSLAIVFGGQSVLVAFGNSAFPDLTEVIHLSPPFNNSISYSLPSDNCDGGSLVSLSANDYWDNDYAVLALCPALATLGLKARGYVMGSSSDWEALNSLTPLVPFQEIIRVDSAGEHFIALPLEVGLPFYFTTTSNNSKTSTISLYKCGLDDLPLCSNGTLLYEPFNNNWVCLSSTIDEREYKSHSSSAQSSPVSLAYTQWPMYGADVQGTRRASNVSSSWSCFPVISSSALVWRFETGNQIQENQPASIGPDGTVYVGSTDLYIYALDPQTKTEKWKTELTGYAPTYSAVYDETLILGTKAYLYSINTTNGHINWELQLANGGGVDTPPIIRNEIVYWSWSSYACIDAFWANNTSHYDSIWQGNYLGGEDCVGEDGNYLSLVFHDVGAVGALIGTFGDYSSVEYGVKYIDPYNGTVLKQYALPSEKSYPQQAALGANGLLYFGAGNYFICAFNIDPSAWNISWCYPNRYGILGSPAISVDGTVYIAASNGSLYALDGESGLEKWSFHSEGTFYASPAIGSDGTIYIGSTLSFYALDGETGILKWSYDFSDSGGIKASPVIDLAGTVVVGSIDNHVYFFNGNAALDSGLWETVSFSPMF